MKKNSEVTDRTRNTIIEAFCSMYEEQPIEKIFVKDVIAKAGYNRSTFYQYFTDIYDLLEYVENDVIRMIRDGAGKGKNDAKALKVFFETKELYLKALLGKYGSMHFIDKLKNELKQYMDFSLSDVDEPIQPYVAEFHMYTTISLFRLWIARNKDISQNELFGLIHVLYNKGYNGLKN